MNAPALPAATEPVVSVEELDARIDAQLTLLASIDAQRADHAATVESGDLDPADYRGWLVRALDRRGYALGELVALRGARHTAAQAEASARTEVARLRLALQRTQAENEALRAAPRTASLPPAPVRMNFTQGTRHQQQINAALENEVRALRAQLTALGEDGNAAPKNVRELIWRAFLEGEVAVLHPLRAQPFLNTTRCGVPREFRDAYVARETDRGYPAPRTTAECDAEAAAQKAALTAEQRA